jgi:hypothetical protein
MNSMASMNSIACLLAHASMNSMASMNSIACLLAHASINSMASLNSIACLLAHASSVQAPRESVLLVRREGQNRKTEPKRKVGGTTRAVGRWPLAVGRWHVAHRLRFLFFFAGNANRMDSLFG